MPESEVLDAPDLAPYSVPTDVWQCEYAAFLQMMPDLLQTCRGQYVAVSGERVVAAAPTFEEAAQAAYARCGYVPLHVGHVTDAPAKPVRIPSPHHVRQVGG